VTVSPGVKGSVHEVNHFHLPSAEVVNEWTVSASASRCAQGQLVRERLIFVNSLNTSSDVMVKKQIRVHSNVDVC